MALVVGVRCSFTGEDAGSVQIHRYWRDCVMGRTPVASSVRQGHRGNFAKPS